MNDRHAGGVALALLALALGCAALGDDAHGAGGAFPTAAGTFPPRLHTEGRYVKDESGRTVVLRGVNKPGFVDVPDGWWNEPGSALYSGIGNWNPDAVKANLDEIRRWGCNVVRFHTCVQWWKENPATFTDRWRTVTYPKPFREMFEDVVRWAGERGLYVIVDLYNLKHGAGQDTLPWPPHAQDQDVVGSRAEFLQLWEEVARQLAPYPHVLFEFYNEPHGDADARAEWFESTQEAIDRVRAIGDNLIVVQWGYGCWVNLDYLPPAHSAGTLDWVEQFPLTGGNLLYSTHLYRNSGGGGSFAHRGSGDDRCWERGDLLEALGLCGVEKVVRELDKPLIVGEVGANMRTEGEERDREIACFRNLLQILEEWEIGYAAWVWHPEEHLAHGLLRDGQFFAGPNAAGEAFLEAVRR